MQIKAGKIMLEMINDFQEKGESFGFETTLAGKKWSTVCQALKKHGYTIHIFFLNIGAVELCIQRVEGRFKGGGHTIPEDVIRRRYTRAQHNFWHVYKEIADFWYLFDTSTDTPHLIATKGNIFDAKYITTFRRKHYEEKSK